MNAIRFAALFVVAFFTCASAHAAVAYNTIALSGETGTALGLGPGQGPGVHFSSSFGTPVLNAAGEVAFEGFLTGSGVDATNDSGIWSNAGGTLAVVAREGGDGPGPGVGAGVNFSNFNIPVLNAAGEVAFSAFLTGTGVDTSNDRGIWSNAGGTLAAVARAGGVGPGPGLGAGVNFSGFGNPVLNAAGEVAFGGRLTGTGVDGTNNSGIWSNASGTLTVVARSGIDGPGPGLGEGVNFSFFGGVPVLNAAGEVAFWGLLTGTGVDTTNNSGIWSNAGGTLAVVARSGGVGPGPGVGAGVNFSDFGAPVLNAAGGVAFRGVLTGTGVDTSNNQGIWSNAGGTLAVVAREGGDGPGPGLGAGVNFSGFAVDPVLNAKGEVAFEGVLTGTGVDFTNDRGIWSNAGGLLQMIVREGDLFDVDPGAGIDLRTISGLGFFGGSGGEDGRLLSFNDSGLLTFQLDFTDGTSGIFTAQVPEPASLALLAGAGALTLPRRGWRPEFAVGGVD